METYEDGCPCLENCPIPEVLQLIGGKWKMQIICALKHSGTIRYGLLKKKISGISNTMLASSLQELENDGLIKRDHYSEIPPRVEYSITDDCTSLIPIVDDLLDWNYLRIQKTVD